MAQHDLIYYSLFFQKENHFPVFTRFCIVVNAQVADSQ